MSNIVREDLGNLHAALTVTLSPADYEPKVKSELNNYRKKAQMKGFRKGKTPMGIIRKMYGKSVLGEVVNEMLQNEVFQYLRDENINILGQPLPAEDQEQLDMEAGQEFVFRFEIGIAPDVELQGLDADNQFDQLTVKIPEETILKDLEAAQTRVGERKEVEDTIQERDSVTINAEELDGDELKANGWATTFSVVVEAERLDEGFKDQLSTLKKGDKLRFEMDKVEKDRDEAFIRKYFLNVEEADDEVEIGNDFEGTIGEVHRVMPAELNQEFFDKYFGEGNVSSEEEAKAKIEEESMKYIKRQAESLLFRDFQDNLMERNPLEMPDAFLKRWLQLGNNLTTEQVTEEYPNFSKNLQWSLIRSKMIERFELEVGEQEVFEGFKERIRGYFGGYGDELVVVNTANRLMQDEKQVDQLRQELMADKLFEKLSEVVTVTPKEISMEEFDAIVNQAREELQARQNPSAPESVEESEEEEVADVE